MKKLQLVFGILIVSLMSFQSMAQERSIDTLLEELKGLSNTPLSEAEVIRQNFNQSEAAILNDYIANQMATSQTGTNSGRLVSEYYVLNLRASANDFGTLDATPPFAGINTIFAPLSVSIFADDFDENGVLYALSFENDSGGTATRRELVTVDITDGTVTVVGDILADIAGATPTGLAFDFTTNTMYATAANVLYSVDVTAGTVTPIGTMSTATSIWLVIDNDGNAFVADISDDTFHSVDLTTGLSTLIGALGLDISFAQEATVDPDTNEIIMAAYTGGGTGGIHSVDKTTGLATLIGDTTPLNAEFGMFSAAGVPILSVDTFNSTDFSLYPNPASRGTVFIETATQGAKQVTVFDILGKTVISATIEGSELNISSLQEGVYMVQVTQNNATATKKLIVK